ncbi:tetratricopeptide repeat protein [Marivirga sp. S37H4]|uniref:histidine kinase n=1 Tax=Marivirga aurantiaca TaxID=2802615 RepID=A0A934X2I7_9BACT|nr:tetratricopeptide repeat protein [Marivirga aurantiaca]MBK6267195.1 tetratricopeptide repeat protein [Marivirga aurantiaca]
MKLRFHIIILLCLRFSVGIAQNKIDSLELALEKSHGSHKIDLLHELVFETWLSYPDVAQKYAIEALSLAKEKNDSPAISKSLRLLGGAYVYKGNYEKSLRYNLEALEIATALNDSLLLSPTLNNIGFAFYHLGSNQNAMEYLMRSKRITELSKEYYGLEHTLNNIGLIYIKAKDYDKAREYFKQGLEVAHKNKNAALIMYAQNNIGLSYLKEEKAAIAKPYFQNSLLLAKEINNKNWEAVALRGMGEVYMLMQQFDSAHYFYDQSFRQRNEIKDLLGLSEIHFLKAKLHIMKGQYPEAINRLSHSDSLAVQIGAPETLLSIYLTYSDLYSRMKDLEKVNKYQQSYIVLRDSIFTEIVNRNLSLLPAKIQDEENRIQLQKSQIELKEKSFENLIYTSILILILPFLVLIVLFFHRNKKTNKTLNKQNQQVEAQKEEIETQKEYLELNLKELEKAKNLISQQKDELEILNQQLEGKVNARTTELKKVNETLRVTSLELDNFIYKSSHDIKGPLVRLMGICTVALLDIKDPEALKYFVMLDKATKRLNKIIDELKLVSELNDKELENNLIDFDSITRECITEISYMENTADIKLHLQHKNEFDSYSDEKLLRIIIFNLLQNSIQFMKSEQLKKFKITINLVKKSNQVILTFILHNLHLKVNEVTHLINSFSKANSEYHNLSIGLYTVKQCVQKLDGSFTLKSNKHQDTIFEVEFPFKIV